MRFLPKALRPLRLTLPVLTSFSGVLNPSIAYAKTEVHFAREANLSELFLGELGSAQRRIDLVVPELTDPALTDKLQALAKDGKKIRVLTSGLREGVKTWECQPCTWLEAQGVDVRYLPNDIIDFYALLDGPLGPKADGETATLLTFSAPRLTARGDASLIRMTREGDFALAYQDEFHFLWSKARDYGDKARRAKVKDVKAPAAPAVLFTSANMTPVKLADGWLLTPTVDQTSGVIAAYVAGAIDHAYDSVDVIGRDLHRIEIFQALTRAAERGVHVRVLLEGREFQGEPVPGSCKLQKDGDAHLDECLAQFASVDLRYLYAPFSDGRQAKIQTNYLVIDGKVALSGNFAWSKAEEFAKLGHLVTLRGGKAVKTYNTQFDKSFAAGREPFRKLAQTSTRLGLCGGRIKTVSVSLGEMKRLRSFVASCE